MADDHDSTRAPASSPCFAHELMAGPDGYHTVDDTTRRDVARWRTAERVRLIDLRMSLSPEHRREVAEEIAARLDQLIDIGDGVAVSVYWSYHGEPNLRKWMQSAHQRGATILLPYAPEKNQPLIFRIWTPETTMKRGVLGIPYPAEGDSIRPDVVIAPLVGYDPRSFRLGYGGGFFDRTLAGLQPRPRVIGVGYTNAEIPTIFPLPHDIPMHTIVTA